MNDQEYNEFIIRVPFGAETSLFKKLIDRMGWRIERKIDPEPAQVSGPPEQSLDDLWSQILG